MAANSFHMYPFVVHSQVKEGDDKAWKPTDWSAYERAVEGNRID